MSPLAAVRLEGYRSHRGCRYVWRGVGDRSAYVASQDEFARLARIYGVIL